MARHGTTKDVMTRLEQQPAQTGVTGKAPDGRT